MLLEIVYDSADIMFWVNILCTLFEFSDARHKNWKSDSNAEFLDQDGHMFASDVTTMLDFVSSNPPWSISSSDQDKNEFQLNHSTIDRTILLPGEQEFVKKCLQALNESLYHDTLVLHFNSILTHLLYLLRNESHDQTSMQAIEIMSHVLIVSFGSRLLPSFSGSLFDASTFSHIDQKQLIWSMDNKAGSKIALDTRKYLIPQNNVRLGRLRSLTRESYPPMSIGENALEIVKNKASPEIRPESYTIRERTSSVRYVLLNESQKNQIQGKSAQSELRESSAHFSDDSLPLCDSSHRAIYGACLASTFKQLLVTKSPNEIYPGIEFTIQVQKLDFYNQVIATDSESFLQISSILPNTSIEDHHVSLSGTTITKLNKGKAEFNIVVKPTFSYVNQSNGLTRVLSSPYLHVTGIDSESEWSYQMQSEHKAIQLHSGICPVGWYLELGSLSLPATGACRLCKKGTYSLDPLVGITDQIPSCLNCPAGAVCLEGGSIVTAIGNWTSVQGRLILIHCPKGHQLINTSDSTPSGEFSHDKQECKPCNTLTEYILNPDTDSCKKCPAGLYCFGSDLVQPKVPGSIWIREGSIYKLISCPNGYQITSGTASSFEATLQQCIACPHGTYIVKSDTDVCTKCPKGEPC